MSNPRDDERRKFEARFGPKPSPHAYCWEFGFQCWMARAEQAETPSTLCNRKTCKLSGESIPALAAAAPVEDRPAPTPPYPDHECAGCNLGKELMVGKPSSIVGQGAIHLPEGWVCMKWLDPRAYAAYVHMTRIKAQLAGAPEKE